MANPFDTDLELWAADPTYDFQAMLDASSGFMSSLSSGAAGAHTYMLSLAYPSMLSIHSCATKMPGQFKNLLDLGNVIALYTAQVLTGQYANHSTNPTKFTTPLICLGISLAPVSIIHTVSTFRHEFPILGNMVLKC